MKGLWRVLLKGSAYGQTDQPGMPKLRFLAAAPSLPVGVWLRSRFLGRVAHLPVAKLWVKQHPCDASAHEVGTGGS